MSTLPSPHRPLRQTHTYAVLEVSRETWKDVYDRLDKAGVLSEYLDENEDRILIVFGTVALQAEIVALPVKIRLNSESIDVDKHSLSYEEIVKMAHPRIKEVTRDVVCTVCYCRGFGPKTEGSLTHGQSVVLKPNMAIDAYFTGSA